MAVTFGPKVAFSPKFCRGDQALFGDAFLPNIWQLNIWANFDHNLAAWVQGSIWPQAGQTEIGGEGKFRECLPIAFLGSSVQPNIMIKRIIQHHH